MLLLLYLLRKLFLHDLFIDLEAALLLRARPTSRGGHRVGFGRGYFDERSLNPSLLRRRLLLLKRYHRSTFFLNIVHLPMLASLPIEIIDL